MKKKVLSMLLTAVILLGMSIHAYADNPVSDARNGVAVLATLEKGDNATSIIGYGTCFFIGKEAENPKYLLTNQHVISDFLTYGAGTTKTYTIDGTTYSSKMILRVYFGAGDYQEAYVVASDEAQDIALLRLSAPTEKRISLPLEVPTDELIAKQVYAIGFPSYADIVDATSSWNIRDALVTTSSISRFVTTSGTGAEWIQVAATEWGFGNSGGPLVTDHGSVIGLVSHAQTDMANTIYMGVNIESVFSMLRNNGIEYDLYEDRVKEETPEETSAPGESAETPVSVVEVTLEPTPEPTTEPTSEPTPEPTLEPTVEPVFEPAPEQTERTTDDSNGELNGLAESEAEAGFHLETWMIAAGAAALVVVVLLIVVLVKRRGSDNRVGYIRSLSAQHAGLKVEVGKEPVIIGREETCGIRFAPDTPGVSGVHCSISYDAAHKEFILTDLKSTYGTFLEGGQRISPHTPKKLHSGDAFYAGDRRNLLRVEASEN